MARPPHVCVLGGEGGGGNALRGGWMEESLSSSGATTPLMQQLQEMREREELIDMVLYLESSGGARETLPLHAVVAAAGSDFFRRGAMGGAFLASTCAWKGSSVHCFTFGVGTRLGLTATGVRKLVDCWYTGRLSLSGDARSLLVLAEVRDVMEAGDFLQAWVGVANMCKDQLLSALDANRWADVYRLCAENPGWPFADQVKAAAVQFAAREFKVVCSTETWSLAWADAVHAVLGLQPEAEDEDQVLAAVVGWLDAAGSRSSGGDGGHARSCHATLERVRLPFVSRAGQAALARRVAHCAECVQLLQSATGWGGLPEAARSSQQRPHWDASFCSALVSFSRRNGKVFRYDTGASAWSYVTALPDGFHVDAATTLQGKLYFWGIAGDRHVGYCWHKDANQPGAAGELVSIAPMSVPRTECGVAPLHGWIYVAGGSSFAGPDDEDDGGGEGQPTSIVERYSPLTNTWETVASMTRRRYSLALVAMDGLLYALSAGTGERYDPSTNAWTPMASMPVRDWKTAASAMGGFLYTASAHSEGVFARYNPTHDVWSLVPSSPDSEDPGVYGMFMVHLSGDSLRLLLPTYQGALEKSFDGRRWGDTDAASALHTRHPEFDHHTCVIGADLAPPLHAPSLHAADAAPVYVHSGCRIHGGGRGKARAGDAATLRSEEEPAAVVAAALRQGEGGVAVPPSSAPRADEKPAVASLRGARLGAGLPPRPFSTLDAEPGRAGEGGVAASPSAPRVDGNPAVASLQAEEGGVTVSPSALVCDGAALIPPKWRALFKCNRGRIWMVLGRQKAVPIVWAALKTQFQQGLVPAEHMKAVGELRKNAIDTLMRQEKRSLCYDAAGSTDLTSDLDFTYMTFTTPGNTVMDSLLNFYARFYAQFGNFPDVVFDTNFYITNTFVKAGCFAEVSNDKIRAMFRPLLGGAQEVALHALWFDPAEVHWQALDDDLAYLGIQDNLKNVSEGHTSSARLPDMLRYGCALFEALGALEVGGVDTPPGALRPLSTQQLLFLTRLLIVLGNVNSNEKYICGYTAAFIIYGVPLPTVKARYLAYLDNLAYVLEWRAAVRGPRGGDRTDREGYLMFFDASSKYLGRLLACLGGGVGGLLPWSLPPAFVQLCELGQAWRAKVRGKQPVDSPDGTDILQALAALGCGSVEGIMRIVDRVSERVHAECSRGKHRHSACLYNAAKSAVSATVGVTDHGGGRLVIKAKRDKLLAALLELCTRATRQVQPVQQVQQVQQVQPVQQALPPHAQR